MKKRWRERCRGQALIMVTIALFAMLGLLGLAVDLGWSFFVRKAARSAADSGALAAVIEGMERMAGSGSFVCGSALTCQAETSCPATPPSPPTNNLGSACLYAQSNGFRTLGNNGHQSVTVEADVPPGRIVCAQPNCVPTAPGVTAYYWATVRVTETVPQLFSAILGNATGTVHARATAVVTDSTVVGSLILLNRENDDNPVPGKRGVNFDGGGGPDITTFGGTLLASQCHGANCIDGNSNNYAGVLGGNGNFNSPSFTYVRGVGQACAGNLPACPGASGLGQSTWSVPPSSNSATSTMFQDPMRGKGQPPLAPVALPAVAVPGGVLVGGTVDNPTKIFCGNYYAIDGITQLATGVPIQLNGSGKNSFFKFVNDAETCANGMSVRGGFGDWVFFGGLETRGTTVEMVPGRYVFAGQNQGPDGQLFSIANGTTLKDQTSVTGTQTDAGELLIYTNYAAVGEQYPGLSRQVNSISALQVAAAQGYFQFGQSGFKMGANDSSIITLHGLNRDVFSDPSDALNPFTPVVMWQDQRNSRVKYTTNGNIDFDPRLGESIDSPKVNAPVNDPRRVMNLGAGVNLNLFGAVYQPRGAWVALQGMGNSAYAGPLQIVSGALTMQGGPKLTLNSISEPIVRRVAALVE